MYAYVLQSKKFKMKTIISINLYSDASLQFSVRLLDLVKVNTKGFKLFYNQLRVR